MSLFSKQKFFCNACGKECNVISTEMLGNKWKVCSSICLIEVSWRETLSIMGEEYYEQPDSQPEEYKK